jgi:LysM repeat protein
MTARFVFISVAITALLCFMPVHASVYLVQKNDTVWSISRKLSVQSAPIIRINDLNGHPLKAGQKLVIPDRLIDYTVRSGDNLTRIAKENKSRLPYIILFNNLADEKLVPGRKIVIPVTETPALSQQAFVKTDEKKETFVRSTTDRSTTDRSTSVKYATNHKVAKGDTMTSLSERYNVSISEIMVWNRKKSPSIFIGERLKILTGTQDSKEEILARTEAVSGKNQSAASSPLSDPAGYEFPLPWSSVDHVTGSGRGVIVYLVGKTAIGSIHDGTVEFAGKMTGYNSVVIINCGDNERAIYGFLDDVSVKEGDRVSRKQPVGNVSQATYLGQVQFYFEMRKGKENVSVTELFPMLRNKNTFAKN